MPAQYTVVALCGGIPSLHHYYVAGPAVAREMAKAVLAPDALILGVLPYWQEFVEDPAT